MYTLSNKDNAPWASDNHSFFILREKKHSYACLCFYKHFNHCTELTKRTYMLYGHCFVNKVFVLQKFIRSDFAAVCLNS